MKVILLETPYAAGPKKQGHFKIENEVRGRRPVDMKRWRSGKRRGESRPASKCLGVRIAGLVCVCENTASAHVGQPK